MTPSRRASTCRPDLTVADMQGRLHDQAGQISALRRTEDVLTGWVALLHAGSDRPGGSGPDIA